MICICIIYSIFEYMLSCSVLTFPPPMVWSPQTLGPVTTSHH